MRIRWDEILYDRPSVHGIDDINLSFTSSVFLKISLRFSRPWQNGPCIFLENPMRGLTLSVLIYFLQYSYSHINAKLGQPYIMKTYFGTTNPPVKIAKITIGDGTLGSKAVFHHLPVVSFSWNRYIKTTLIQLSCS